MGRISPPEWQLISKQELIADLQLALQKKHGYAFGKIGASPKQWMIYGLLHRQGAPLLVLKALEKSLLFHGLKQSGLFPANPDFYCRYNDLYLEAIRNLDNLGLFLEPVTLEKKLIQGYKLNNKLIYYLDQEPDRSLKADEDNCYLPLFKDRNLLIICPFAHVLAERANQEIFENVWAKTGKPWFHPASVQSLEFPYGFSPSTWKQYPTSLDLLSDLQTQIQQRNFDVALVGAGGLAIPLVAFIKSLGKIGLDLGGHLQMLFGVIGKRWRHQAEWQQYYFNEFWIDMPNHYQPLEQDVCDNGAYW